MLDDVAVPGHFLGCVDPAVGADHLVAVRLEVRVHPLDVCIPLVLGHDRVQLFLVPVGGPIQGSFPAPRAGVGASDEVHGIEGGTRHSRTKRRHRRRGGRSAPFENVSTRNPHCPPRHVTSRKAWRPGPILAPDPRTRTPLQQWPPRGNERRGSQTLLRGRPSAGGGRVSRHASQQL